MPATKTRLVAMLLCQEITRDDGGKTTIHGVLNRSMGISGFPYGLKAKVFVRFEARPGPHKVDVRVVDTATGDISRTGAVDIVVGRDEMETEGYIDLQLAFSQEQTLRIELRIDGQRIGHVMLKVEAVNLRQLMDRDL